MVVQLSGNLERLVQEKMASGLYRSTDDVIERALFALDERDRALDARATAFKTEIDQRLAKGPATPLDFAEVKRILRQEIEAQQGTCHSASV